MKYLILFFITLLFTISCSEDENLGCSNEPDEINSELIPYNFSIGSYWIYSDTHGLLDSVSVIDANTSNFYYGGGMGSCPLVFQTKTIEFSSDLEIFYDYFSFIESIITAGDLYNGFIYGATDTNLWGGHRFIKTLDTLELENFLFTDVKLFYTSKSKFYSTNVYNYFKDSIGIVRRVLVSDAGEEETWDLTDYNVSIDEEF